MMKAKIIIRYCTGFLMLYAVASCKKMDSTYEKFIKGGAIVYPGKVDTVMAFAGKKRVLLRWAAPKDQNITAYKAFWNFGNDSVYISVASRQTADSVEISIDSLEEGAYNFTVYSYDKDNHKSVGESVIASAYGSIFSSSIVNRAIRTFKKDAAASSVSTTWVGLDPKCIGTEWNYTRKNGLPGVFFSPIGDNTVITDCNTSRPVLYRSLFLPEPDAIDIFYTEFKSL
jgi:hypothetical protein